ncbi:MAG: ABC transporter substrate-binding protein, partial [Bauldia sp.]|nr:ABC transporter substrate-binding protein [Bauldia sp.]
FWVAQQILDGADVPKDLTVPFLRIDQGTLEESLANTEPGGVANTEYSLDDAKKVVDEAKM